jgi:hypothetical protein
MTAMIEMIRMRQLAAFPANPDESLPATDKPAQKYIVRCGKAS